MSAQASILGSGVAVPGTIYPNPTYIASGAASTTAAVGLGASSRAATADIGSTSAAVVVPTTYRTLSSVASTSTGTYAPIVTGAYPTSFSDGAGGPRAVYTRFTFASSQYMVYPTSNAYSSDRCPALPLQNIESPNPACAVLSSDSASLSLLQCCGSAPRVIYHDGCYITCDAQNQTVEQLESCLRRGVESGRGAIVPPGIRCNKSAGPQYTSLLPAETDSQSFAQNQPTETFVLGVPTPYYPTQTYNPTRPSGANATGPVMYQGPGSPNHGSSGPGASVLNLAVLLLGGALVGGMLTIGA